MNTDASLSEGAASAFRAGFGAVLRIEPDVLGALVIDGRGETCRVLAAHEAAGLPPPDATWRANADTLTEIFARRRALEAAYLSGRLQIAGDMSVMARLILEAPK